MRFHCALNSINIFDSFVINYQNRLINCYRHSSNSLFRPTSPNSCLLLSSRWALFHGWTSADPQIVNSATFAMCMPKLIQNTMRHSDCRDYNVQFKWPNYVSFIEVRLTQFKRKTKLHSVSKIQQPPVPSSRPGLQMSMIGRISCPHNSGSSRWRSQKFRTFANRSRLLTRQKIFRQ